LPYIKLGREPLAQGLVAPENPGELNFVITGIIDEYLSGDFSYQAINDVVGALECAKMELYRRVAAPYEDKKIEENGDVYSPAVLQS